MLALGGVFIALGLLSDATYALGAARAGARLRAWPRFPSVQRYASGAVYIGLGLAAALTGSRPQLVAAETAPGPAPPGGWRDRARNLRADLPVPARHLGRRPCRAGRGRRRWRGCYLRRMIVTGLERGDGASRWMRSGFIRVRGGQRERDAARAMHVHVEAVEAPKLLNRNVTVFLSADTENVSPCFASRR